MPVYRRSFVPRIVLLAAVWGIAAAAGSLRPIPAAAQEPKRALPPTASLAPVTPAQSDEIARLRPFLGASGEAKIQPATVSKLSANFPVKVFLSTGLDIKVRDNFAQWVSEWQKKDARKYGAVELVTSASQADVILVCYALKERATQKTVNKPIPSTTKTYDNRIWPSGYGSYGATSSFPLGRRPVTVMMAPIYAYVVERTPEGFQILARDEAISPVVEEKNTGQLLWNEFKKLLKQRGDGAKKEQKKSSQ